MGFAVSTELNGRLCRNAEFVSLGAERQGRIHSEYPLSNLLRPNETVLFRTSSGNLYGAYVKGDNLVIINSRTLHIDLFKRAEIDHYRLRINNSLRIGTFTTTPISEIVSSSRIDTVAIGPDNPIRRDFLRANSERQKASTKEDFDSWVRELKGTLPWLSKKEYADFLRVTFQDVQSKAACPDEMLYKLLLLRPQYRTEAVLDPQHAARRLFDDIRGQYPGIENAIRKMEKRHDELLLSSFWSSSEQRYIGQPPVAIKSDQGRNVLLYTHESSSSWIRFYLQGNWHDTRTATDVVPKVYVRFDVPEQDFTTDNMNRILKALAGIGENFQVKVPSNAERIVNAVDNVVIHSDHIDDALEAARRIKEVLSGVMCEISFGADQKQNGEINGKSFTQALADAALAGDKASGLSLNPGIERVLNRLQADAK